MSTATKRWGRIGIALAMLFFLSQKEVSGQTAGLIVKPATGAGSAILDPNGDGYTSATTDGFGTNDVENSEIPYKAIPQFSNEPNSDLERGSNKGCTDFADDGSGNVVSTYYDGTNLLIRFRLCNLAKSSEGYSILVDDDQKFGASGANADPNYVSGNPGYEFEIVLESNHDVALYDVDGTTSPTLKYSFSYDIGCQKSKAYNISPTLPQVYFYDFYMPFSQISSNFGITSSTPLRFTANTVMAPTSAFANPISDVGGIDDNAYGNNTEKIWQKLIDNFYPTSVSDVNSGIPAHRSDAPTLSSPILNGATSCSVTVTAAGTIKIYKTGTSSPVCSTTVASAGTYTVSGCTSFATGDLVYATNTESGKGESQSSNVVTVTGCSGVSPIPINLNSYQNEKYLRGSGYAGATISLYNNGSYYSTGTTITVNATGAWQYAFCTGNGNHCIPCGTWYVTQTISGHCESGISNTVTIGFSNGGACATNYSTSPAPTITTSPIYTNNTSVSGTLGSTPAASTTVYLYINGILKGSVATSTTSWTVSSLTFSIGDTVTCKAKTTGNYYYTDGTNTVYVTPRPPVVSSPLTSSSTSVSGTSVEASGTTITVYQNGTSIGTTTVGTDGTWTKTGVTLTAGASITAKTTSNGQTSAASNTVVVGYPSWSGTVTISTSTTYYAGGSTVSGTLSTGAPTGGGTITLYEDGAQIATVTMTAGSTSWSITGLASTYLNNTNYLYTGGVLQATFTPTTSSSGSESGYSNSVTVQCQSPSTLSGSDVSPVTYNVCQGNTGSCHVTNSESDVIYTLRDGTDANDIGPSYYSTGGTITLVTYSMNTVGANTVKVKALRLDAISCSSTLADTAKITVNAPVTSDAGNAGSGGKTCSGSVTLGATNPSTGTGVWTVDSGSATFTDATVYNTTASSLNYGRNVLRWTVTNGDCVAYDTVVYIRDCDASYTVETAKPYNQYNNNEVVATASDADGSISSASLVSGTMPPGTSLNTSNGNIYVSDSTLQQSGEWTVYIKTTDVHGGQTTVPVTILYTSTVPIKLISFKANLSGKAVKLNWSTATEMNNDFFTIERSADGNSFYSIEKIKGAGNSNSILYYSSVDLKPLRGVSFYRLKQTDFNGAYSYSSIVSIHNNDGETDHTYIQVYPNPADNANLRINLNGLEKGTYSATVTNAIGSIEAEARLDILDGSVDMDFHSLFPINLKPGVYTILISNATESYKERFIIR